MGLPETASQLAARQHGAISRAQLHAAGMSEPSISRLVTTGQLATVHRGVTVLAGSPSTPLRAAWAAHLALGPTSLVSGLTAVALHGLEPRTFPRFPTVLVPYREAPTRPQDGIHVVRSRTLETEHRSEVDGLPVVSLRRLPVEVAADLRTGDLAALVREVVRRTGCAPVDLLDVAHHAGNRAGVSRLRHLLRDLDPRHARTASPAEGALLSLLTRHGLPTPEVNYTVFAADGTVAGVLDLAWPDHLAAVELDSLRHHATTEAQAHDLERQQRLELLGWRFRRVTPHQVKRNPEHVVRVVRAHLAACARQP